MRDMKIISNEGAEKAGWDIVVPFPGEVVGKAVLQNRADGIDIMKSTKRFKVKGGWIYNTSTEIHKVGGGLAIAEALVFVPE